MESWTPDQMVYVAGMILHMVNIDSGVRINCDWRTHEVATPYNDSIERWLDVVFPGVTVNFGKRESATLLKPSGPKIGSVLDAERYNRVQEQRERENPFK